MRKNLFIALLFISFIGIGQSGINYKAVIKDGGGDIVANDLIQVQFTILDGAVSVYQETHSPTTDANGIIILNIGEGAPVSGTFGSIDWSSMDHFLNVMINTGGGLQDMGTTAFKTVPYALHSADEVFSRNGTDGFKETGNIGIGTANPTNRLHISDVDDASILLQTPLISDLSSIRLENGHVEGNHTFFKIENQNDFLGIGVDSDLAIGNDYADVVTISALGNIVTQGSLRLGVGATVSEFSTDGTLVGNSNTTMPTERAVKTYVDNTASSFTEDSVGLVFGGSQTLTSNSFVDIQATTINSLTITNVDDAFIRVHVEVEGTVTKFFMLGAAAPEVVVYGGGEGTLIEIKVFAEFGSKMLFFEGVKYTGNSIVGLLRVKE